MSQQGDSEERGAVDVIHPIEVSKRTLGAGDVLLVLAQEGFHEKWEHSSDFLMITGIGELPKKSTIWQTLPLFVFLGMIVSAAAANIDMVQAGMAAAAVLVMGGWVNANKAHEYVQWDLLLLIGSMLGMSHALISSGLAAMFAQGVQSMGLGGTGLFFLIYAICSMMTNVLTNNAAAGLMFPLALTIAQTLNVSYKPFMFVVMAGSSASFLTPIGYQTNMMVWGPGGYKFTDFTKFGAPLQAIHMVVCCLLVGLVWPIDEPFDWRTTSLPT